MRWIKRYDEVAIATRIKELALKRKELYDGDDLRFMYCPKIKDTISCRRSECGYCDCNLKNMIQTNERLDEGCLGYIPQPHSVKLLNESTKLDMYEVFMNLRRSKYGKQYGNKTYFSPGDIKRTLNNGETVKIYNDELNKTYLFDGTSRVGQWMGYEINMSTGEVSSKLSFLPLYSFDKWQIIK